ncbi:MAG: nucleotidyltransferase family protein [Chloroflexota bacterium]
MPIDKTTQMLFSCLKVSKQSFTNQNASETTPDEWKALLDLADRQRLTPLLYDRLKEKLNVSVIPSVHLDRLKAAHRKNSMRNMHLFQRLHQILKVFATHEIPVIVLKGAFLAHAIYPSRSQRYMLDIDILVQKAHLAQAAELLIEMGYQPKGPLALDSVVELLKHLPVFRMPNDPVPVELHWTIASPRQFHDVSTDNFWDDLEVVPFGKGAMAGFCPEELLLHLCIHASYQHLFFQGIRAFYDVDVTVRHFEARLNWRLIEQRAMERKWSKGVYLVLSLTKCYFDTPIPDAVLEALRPATIPQPLIATVEHQMALKQGDSSRFSLNVVQLAGNQDLIGKAKLTMQRFFPARREMALRYPAEANSWRIYLYYPIRGVTLLLRYCQKVWALWRGDRQIQSYAQRQLMLTEWLGLS